MPDETAVAASSPAEPQYLSLEELTPEQRNDWQLSGELPEAPPKKEESAPSQESEAAPEKAEAQPESAPGKSKVEPRRRGTPAAERVQELLEERGKLRAQLEASQSELETLRKSGEKKEAAPPAAQEKQPEAKPRPVLADFEGDYEKWAIALAEWTADQKLEAYRAEEQKRTEESRVKEHNLKLQNNWKERVQKSMERHADFNDVALADEVVKAIPQGSFLDAMILQREEGTELLYYLGTHPDEIERLSKLHPIDLAFEVARLPLNGKSPEEPKAEEPKVTAARKPPVEVGGKASALPDEVEAALRTGDARAYMRAKNAQELRARKG